jgi:ParB-like nuclease family protein
VARVEAPPVVELPVGDLHPSPWNPNEQSEETFNALVRSISEIGLPQPILVCPRVEGGYWIIGGEHRWRACQQLGYETVPCVSYPDWSEDQRKFQNMRLNVITGKISPAKFTAMFTSMRQRYSEEVMAGMMGFASEEEMKKLIKRVADGLPPDLRRTLQTSQREIRNVRDLNDVMNRLMRDHGNTLQYGFMFFVHSGQTHLMVQMDAGLKRILEGVADRCVRERLEIADVLTAHLVRLEAAEVAGGTA